MPRPSRDTPTRTIKKNSQRKSNKNKKKDKITSPHRRPNDPKKKEEEACLCFQDVLQSHQDDEYNGEEEEEENPTTTGPAGAVTANNAATAAANCFFELANATHVSYRIDNPPNHHDDDDDDALPKVRNKSNNTIQKQQQQQQQQQPAATGLIKIRQDHNTACGQHTGGIVWETSYLLLNYLRQCQRQQQQRGSRTDHKDNHDDDSFSYDNLQTVLEVGAGCGLLGIGIYHSNLAKHVILTETDSVLANLTYNVQQNIHLHNHIHKGDNNKDRKHQQQQPQTKETTIRVCELDWTRYKEDCMASALAPHSMDLIVGTDVVFSTRFVRPLLETLRYLAHSNTQILLCLQERCPDSHRLFLESAYEYGLTVRDISKQVTDVPTCEWGHPLDCCILELRVMMVSTTTTTPIEPDKKRRKRDDGKGAPTR